MQKTRMGSLDVLTVKGSEDGPVVILCHGFGASASDLFPLAHNIKARPGTNWYFPEGPLEFSLGPNYTGRAWFPVVSEELARLLATGRKIEFADVVPPGLEDSRKKIEELVQLIGKPPSQITIGGFSQGSMLATDYFLKSKDALAGLAILSGTLICREEWTERAKGKRGAQFLQTHGLIDPVLPFNNAKALEEVLRGGGLSGEFVTFQGGHEIPPPVLKKLSEFLRRD